MSFPRSRSPRPLASRNFILGFLVLFLMFCVLQLTRGLRNRNIASEQYPDHPSPKGSSVQPKLADSLSAQALLARPLKTDLSAIPKLFHQSWSSKTLPAKFERWSQSCRRAHPDWKWVLWTDQDNFDLVRKYAPWFLDTYEMLGSRIPVYQADLVRNLYMHVYGGYSHIRLSSRRQLMPWTQRICRPRYRMPKTHRNVAQELWQTRKTSISRSHGTRGFELCLSTQCMVCFKSRPPVLAPPTGVRKGQRRHHRKSRSPYWSRSPVSHSR